MNYEGKVSNNETLDASPGSDVTIIESSDLLASIERGTNPYEFCLAYLDDKCVDENKDSSDTRFITMFENFLTENDRRYKYLPLLTTAIQLKAFAIIKKLKNEEVQKTLIEIFSLKSAKGLFTLFELRNDLKVNRVKHPTITLIKLLELSSNFNARELLVPLLLEDKLEDIYEILEINETLRIPFIQIIDNVVGNKVSIPGLNKKKFMFGEKAKGLFYVGLKLMKKFSLPSKETPNIIHFQTIGRLRYLFINNYKDKEKEVTLQSFLYFVKDLAINDSLKKETLKLFAQYGDYKSAEWYLSKVNVQLSDIPFQMRAYSQRSGGPTLSFEATNHQSNQIFYKLNLTSNNVMMVDSTSEFDVAVKYLSTLNVIAYDHEWKPVRLYDEVVKLSLIQVASNERVYIFDMLKLPDILSDNQWNTFGALFSSDHIKKLTYSYTHEEEKENFRQTNRCLEKHIMDIANVIDIRAVEEELDESHPNVFTYETGDLKGLCGLVFKCFGKPLDKIEQCSYWTLRPLSSGQLNYAALDAFCLLEVLNYLTLKCDQMKIDCKHLQKDMAQSARNIS